MSAALVALLLAHSPTDLKWLSGSWRSTDAKHQQSAEEVWVCTDGGLSGMYREVLEGEPGFYELSTILPEGDRLVLSSRMFDRALKDSKKTASGPLRFVLEKLEFQKATFKGEGANKATLVYALLNPHRLHVTLDRADGAPVEQLDFWRFFL